MKKTVKLFSYIFLSSSIILSSCLKQPEKEVRTPELEQQEINAAIAQLEADGHNVDTTALGTYYVVTKAGDGPTVQPGDTISLIYSGFLINGLVFDTSFDHYTDGIWEFQFKEIQLIPGFDDGIALMNKNMELDILIPSTLGYGALGSGNLIGAYQPLLFSLQLKDIKPLVQE